MNGFKNFSVPSLVFVLSMCLRETEFTIFQKKSNSVVYVIQTDVPNLTFGNDS
jgi:hypothetical protein